MSWYLTFYRWMLGSCEEVIFRAGKGIPKYMPYFNQRVLLTNQYLSVVLSPHVGPNSTFWHHRDMWQDDHPLLRRDGVHFNAKGTWRLFRSIGGAVIQTVYSLQELFDNYYF